MTSIRTLHLTIGILSAVAFLATGQYMDLALGQLSGMPDGPRMLYRSSHIYLLLVALLNVVMGLYLTLSPGRLARALQLIGSAIILLLPALMLVSFFAESHSPTLDRPFARNGMFLILAGVGLHFIASLLPSRG